MNEIYKKHIGKFKYKREYTLYRKESGIPFSDRIIGRDLYFKFVDEFFKEIRENMLQQDGGVFIKGIGYFFNWMLPKKRVLRLTGRKDAYYFHSDLYYYIPMYVPVNKASFWTMDRRFSRTYIEDFKTKLKEGKIYKSYLGTLLDMKKMTR